MCNVKHYQVYIHVGNKSEGVSKILPIKMTKYEGIKNLAQNCLNMKSNLVMEIPCICKPFSKLTIPMMTPKQFDPNLTHFNKTECTYSFKKDRKLAHQFGGNLYIYFVQPHTVAKNAENIPLAKVYDKKVSPVVVR